MTDEATAPRRLRAQDVIEGYKEIIEQLTARGSEPTASVEFTRNAKGETQITTKVHAPANVSQDELTRLADRVYLAAQETYNEACAKYPTGTGFARNEGQEPPK